MLASSLEILGAPLLFHMVGKPKRELEFIDINALFGLNTDFNPKNRQSRNDQCHAYNLQTKF